MSEPAFTIDDIIEPPAQPPSDYRGNAEECAKNKGLVIVYPAENQLFLDIDDKESWDLFLNRVHIPWRLGNALER